MKEVGFEEALATSQQNPHAKWPVRHTSNRLEPECWPGLRPSFAIQPGAKVFTIGSCFAREIEMCLAKAGFDVPTRRFLEQAGFAHDFSGEILNKYTPPSIHQELAWTRRILDRDGVVRAEDIEPFLLELKSGKVIDLQRRFADRFGSSREQALAARQQFFDLFKQAFDAQVVVITLGLVECWWDRKSGQYVEMSAALGEHNEDDRFVFRRLDYPECLAFTAQAIELLNGAGDKDILITTSPIPITRTFTADDVIVANTYSKSVLRAVAGKVAEGHPRVDYFPSYENVMLTRRPELWNDDLAHVEPAFVDRIMRRVQEAYVTDANPSPQADAGSRLQDAISRLSNLVRHEQWPQAGEVIAEISALRSQAPQFATPFAYYLSAAGYLLHTGQDELARQLLDKVDKPAARGARDIDAIRSDEQFYGARLLDRLGEAERAARLRSDALDSMRDRPAVMKSWIRTQFAAGEAEEALVSMAFAERCYADSADMLDFLAQTYQSIDRLDDAERLSAAALAADPANGDIMTRRAGLLISLDRGDEAMALVREAPGEAPPRLLRRLAAEHLKLRNPAEAEPLARRLVGLEPDDAQGHALLARCLLQLGRPAEALAEAARAHALEPDDRFQRLIEQAESAIAVQARRQSREAGPQDDGADPAA